MSSIRHLWPKKIQSNQFTTETDTSDCDVRVWNAYQSYWKTVRECHRMRSYDVGVLLITPVVDLTTCVIHCGRHCVSPLDMRCLLRLYRGSSDTLVRVVVVHDVWLKWTPVLRGWCRRCRQWLPVNMPNECRKDRVRIGLTQDHIPFGTRPSSSRMGRLHWRLSCRVLEIRDGYCYKTDKQGRKSRM